jgi:antitoxin (DNA-binding transcriptional repressor) of toxin-antitoxin stability system
MKTINITKARKNIKTIVDRVKYRGEVFGIGRRNSIDAVIVQFPPNYNRALSDITNVNANSRSFDFLKDEPNIYDASDLKKIYD